MITIVDYGNTSAKEIAEALIKLSAETKISNKERDILSADRIILPDSNDISSSIRKLHLLNLFSVLRIVKRPVLGIGTGMHLMTKAYAKFNAACLGCFPVECESRLNDPQQTLEELQLNIIEGTGLLKGIKETDKFMFHTNCIIPVTPFSTSTIDIDGLITSSIEKENLFGVQFNPERSGEAGVKLIQNFLKT